MELGARDNGLRAGNYVALRDVDPRVVDDVLTTLRERGIAAYATPATGTVGGSMETKLPGRPMHRLYVDDQRVEEARGIVDDESGTAVVEEDRDFESSWQQVLSSLQSSPTHLSTPWPEREDLTLEERERAYDEEHAEPEDVAHFVPPAPPPLPRLRPATWGALATMAVCVVVMATNFAGSGMDVLAFIIFVAAAASLVYNMRQGPPDDDGWDDGAVV